MAEKLWRALSDTAWRWWGMAPQPTPRPVIETPFAGYEPLRRVVLTDDVSRSLFEEYEAHGRGERGSDECGWALLGLRERDEAFVLATLPAGTASASHAHIRFNHEAQALGYRIVRQAQKRLVYLGLVHTHPGSLRHPSDGDFRGDSQWVRQLRGGEGIFGIGTTDAPPSPTADSLAWQPDAHVQCLGGLRLSWYVLGSGDRTYRPIPIELTLGPDLGRSLRPVWSSIESEANRLDTLARQQSQVRFEVAEGTNGPVLAVAVGLAEPGSSIRVLLDGKELRFFLIRDGEMFAVEPGQVPVDQGIYLILAELAAHGGQGGAR